MFVKTDYTSNEVEIPDSFLTAPPEKAPVSHKIDWSSTVLPQNQSRVAFVVDNVLSPEECKQLISLAEASVPVEGDASPWKPALITVGEGLEAPAPGYRESDRIVWDQQAVADRIGERIMQAEGVREQLASFPRPPRAGVWKIRRVNKRLRFLKYSAGQFFKPHCDSSYAYEKDGASFGTQYTIQLYLNNSAATDPNSDLVGGATSFLSWDRETRMDVNPRAGCALIFQHAGLLHEGAVVEAGTKYTMRAEIIYENLEKKVEEKKVEEKKSLLMSWWEKLV